MRACRATRERTDAQGDRGHEHEHGQDVRHQPVHEEPVRTRVGVVGQLQLEVLISRLQAEYNVAAEFEPAPFETARWVSAENPADLKAFMEGRSGAMDEDRDGAPVFLARDAWEVNYVAERSPNVRFSATRERASA